MDLKEITAGRWTSMSGQKEQRKFSCKDQQRDIKKIKGDTKGS